MAKKTLFYCTGCGYESSKWLGRCPGCGAWNTMEEVPLPARAARRPENELSVPGSAKAARLQEISAAAEDRIISGIDEFDRVLGGGAVMGSVILIGGDPGIGKSTLLLQAAAAFSGHHHVLYASGEESLRQIKMRAQRLRINADFQVVATTELEQLLAILEEQGPQVLVLDSVQSFFRSDLEGVPGSVNQVREVTAALTRLAKENGMIVFLIGHVTKEGIMAGPRLLEHMVDAVLYLEGDRYHSFRVLRGVKNRFGSTNEIGVFVMEEQGLQEVANPSYLFITGQSRESGGAVVTASMEGTRPLLVEIQSLVVPSNYAAPRRTSAGIDLNRVALIMAVLEKHAGVSFVGLDTFVNVVGGVRLVETAVDLALGLSLVSSLRGKGLSAETVVFGEVGLTGEIRPVSRIKQRINEAAKLGFNRFIIPRPNLENLGGGKVMPQELQLIGVSSIKEAVGIAFLS